MANSEPDPQNETDPQDEADPQDVTRRKFREALERKRARAGGAAGHTEGGGQQSRAHGPVEQRRTFRRKSGG